jgi:hypothetical protein
MAEKKESSEKGEEKTEEVIFLVKTKKFDGKIFKRSGSGMFYGRNDPAAKRTKDWFKKRGYKYRTVYERTPYGRRHGYWVLYYRK